MKSVKYEILSLTEFAESWKELLQINTHDFYHHPEYLKKEAEISKGVIEVLVAEDQGETLFLFPYCKRKIPTNLSLDQDVYDLTSVYGYPAPLWAKDFVDENAKIEILKGAWSLLESKKICSVFVRFHPLIDPDIEVWKHFGQVINHGQTIYIDLAQSEETLLKGIKKRHKYEISQLNRNPSISVSYDLKYLKSFVDSYNETMSRLGAGQSYFFKDDYYANLVETFGENLTLISVLHEGDFTAGALFIRTGDIVEYHLSGTVEKYLPLAPTKMVIYEAMKKYHREGAKILHLGGGRGGEEDSLFRFKSGYSDLRSAFYTFRSVLNKELYVRLCQAKSIEVDASASALDLGGFFPLYRK